MNNKRPVGITILGIIMISVSIMFINVAVAVNYSYGFDTAVNAGILLGWLVPAMVGIGIMRLSNFFRIVAIYLSIVIAIWTPIMYFFVRGTFETTGAKLPLFSRYEIIDLFLIFFSIYAIYFLTRPKIKGQFR